MNRPHGRSEPSPARGGNALDPRVAAARQRPMAERLELALSWNLVASELRAGLNATKRRR